MATAVLIDPTLGKGKKDLFRFRGSDDVISIDEDPTDPEGDDFFSGGPGDTGFNINSGSGDDTIVGSRAKDTLEGGKGSDTLSGGDGSDVIYGGKANGDEGKDRETTGNVLHGELDSGTASDGTGFGDMIFGADGAAGVDTPGRAGNFIFGDYGFLSVSQSLDGVGYIDGGDTIVGGDAAHGIGAVNELIGDVGTLSLQAGAIYTGGADTITAGSGTGSENTLYGDTIQISFADPSAAFEGGDDLLVSGTDASDTMYGDTSAISGAGTFVGGTDTFVFGASNGRDTIFDFRTTDGDKIDLTATELTWADLDTNAIAGLDAGDDHVSIANGDTVIDLGAAADDGTVNVNTLTVTNVTGLMETDFDFILVV